METQTRMERLQPLIDETQEIYDKLAAGAIESGNVPRYALLTSEGSPESSYRDNPNLTLHATLDDLAQAAAEEAEGGWCVLQALDLDTGDDVTPRYIAEAGITHGFTVACDRHGEQYVSRSAIVAALRDAHRHDSAADAVEYVSDLVGWVADEDDELAAEQGEGGRS